jgi:hypothetical protein
VRAAVLSGLVLLSVACWGDRAPALAPAAAAEPPRLVVLIVVDQLPMWSWPTKLAAAEDGIARIAATGRRHHGRYPFALTQTAPGHAALGTGTTPSVNGILGNEWWRRDAGDEIKADEDPASPDPSAIWLRVDGVADVLARERPAADAVAVSLKSRGSILSLGHAGLPVWYDWRCACFITQGDAPPAWLDQLATTHPITPRIAEPWTPLDPGVLARLSGGPDDADGEVPIPGWDRSFPHDRTTARNPAKAVIDTPLGNEIVVEAAIAAVRGERLGADDVADLLVVSFSAHDYVSHAFGPDSWEAWDTWLRLDRQIGDLLRAIDAEVGAGRWALVFSSDHGAPDLPERRHARGLAGARISFDVIAAAAEAAAARVAGPGSWIATARWPTIFLSEAARALPEPTRAQLIDAIVAGVAGLPGIARADRTADVAGDCDRRTGDDQAICLSLDPVASGEVFYAPAEGTILHKASWVDGVAHGSFHAYDRDVPIVVVVPGVAAADVPGVASTLSVAPTVAELLGVPPPPAATEPSLLR